MKAVPRTQSQKAMRTNIRIGNHENKSIQHHWLRDIIMQLLKHPDNAATTAVCFQLLIVCILLFFSLTAGADALERRQAKRLHDRLAGIPPEESVLDDMEAALMAGNQMAAAYIAMDDKAFYNITLKNFATPWTNRCSSSRPRTFSPSLAEPKPIGGCESWLRRNCILMLRPVPS